jgi:hypothetical protein
MAQIEELENGSIIVNPTAEEKTSLFKLAMQRCMPKRAKGIKQKFHAPQGQIQSDYIGLLGEFAAAAYLRCLFDTSIHFTGDGGVDLQVGDYTVQVKSTFYKKGRLLYMPYARFNADYDVLAIVNHSTGEVKLVGWCTRDTVMRNRKLKDLGHGKRYVVERKHLRKMSTLHIPHVYDDPSSQLMTWKEEEMKANVTSD